MDTIRHTKIRNAKKRFHQGRISFKKLKSIITKYIQEFRKTQQEHDHGEHNHEQHIHDENCAHEHGTSLKE